MRIAAERNVLDAYNALRDVCRGIARSEGKTAAEWRDVAMAFEATLQSETADMNRYFEDWQKSVAQVQELQGGMDLVRYELESSKSGWEHTANFFRRYFGVGGRFNHFSREGEFYTGAVERLIKAYDELCSRAEQADSLSSVGAVPSVEGLPGAWTGRPLPECEVLTQVYLRAVRRQADLHGLTGPGFGPPRLGIQAVLDALEPYLRPVDETAETLRGRLRQVSGAVDEEKRGRLNAETAIDELQGRLSAERTAAEMAMKNQREHYESCLLDLRNNHANEVAGLQALVAQRERDAWHDKLMVRSLSFGMDEKEFARISEENWALMRSGVDGKVLTPGGAIVAQLHQEEIHHEEHEGHEGEEKKGDAA